MFDDDSDDGGKTCEGSFFIREKEQICNYPWSYNLIL